MNKKLSCLFPAVVLTAACLAPNSSGQVVLLGNLSGGNDNGSTTTLNTTRWKAVGFTLAGGQDYNITDVQLHLAGYSGASNPSVGFFTDNAGVPSTTAVGTALSDPGGNAGGTANFTFTPSSTITLTGGNTYWLVVKDTVNASLAWVDGNPEVTPTSAAGATFNSYKFSVNAGGAWGAPSTILNNFQIDATAVVPEPVHYTLAGAGALLGFAFWRRIKLNKAC